MCTDCRKTLVVGDWPFPCGGSGDHSVHGGTLLSAIHPSERVTVFRNPATGEVRFPARSDSPIHPKYQAQGYVREQIVNHQDLRNLERTTGKLHERSHYDPGSGRAEREMTAE